MIRQAIAAAREDMLLRELIEWTELREMCLQALQARARAAAPALALPAAVHAHRAPGHQVPTSPRHLMPVLGITP
jgi:hypothetical protein